MQLAARCYINKYMNLSYLNFEAKIFKWVNLNALLSKGISNLKTYGTQEANFSGSIFMLLHVVMVRFLMFQIF